jgi:hypothetical protein
MYDKFVTRGYPVVIGEFGAVDKTSADSTSNKYRAVFAKTLCAYCKQYGAVPVYWDNRYNGAYGFGLIDRSTCAVTQQEIIDAIISGIGTVIPPSSAIAPTAAVFDKKTSVQADVTVTVTLNGNTLNGIKNGSASLVSGADYTVSGNTVTILRSYLAKQAVGTTSLTFDFSAGNDPVLTVNVVDSSDQSGSFKIQEYNGNTLATANTLYPRLKLVNTGSVALNLSNIKIRYYYTIDAEKAQSFTCDWSTAGAGNVTGTFVIGCRRSKAAL